MNGHTCARIGHMSSGARLYGVMNALLSLAKGRRINGYGGSTTSMKNGRKKHIIPYTKSKGISIMIWAAIWGGGHTEIYRMSRDEESARRGYSSRSYLEII
ncbi:uncharacterized protein ASPGLDRAFT_45406, partial [Aspergillus glaucus CBS 516.65]